ncbi:hypothetical protein [Sulfitobacter sp. M22]|uniref:hypothetical protein n=1 Tax=Sulfitobacter sp. M22 TaxID=2675332 RepID=UPI001F280A2F|nr:hypothetical protein [Sulfitobacter sp. M22]MCF7728699.1 hypothetical protein [Sulfitobacter sp. M22]
MSKLQESIGVKLKLDGLIKIRKDLIKVGDQLSKTAEKVSAPFKAAGNTISKALKGATSATNKFDRAIVATAKRVGSSLATISKAATRVSAALARAGAKGGAALARGVGAGINKIKAAVKGVALALPAGLIATGAGVAANARNITQLERLSKAGATSIETFSLLAGITESYGMEADDLGGALADLADKTGRAAAGEGVKEFFDRINVSVRDAKGNVRDTGAVFIDVMKNLKKVSSDTERSWLSQELIGGDAEKLASMLNASNRELAERARLVRDSGQIVSREEVLRTEAFSKSLYAVTATIKGLWKTVSLRLYPAFTKAFGTVQTILERNRGLIVDNFASGVERLLGLLTRFVQNVFEVGSVARSDTGFGALVDITQAAGRGAGMLIKKFSGVGSGIKTGLGEGIKALRDFALAFMVVSGEENTAGELFGRKITANEPATVARRITRNGIEDIDQQQVTSGYALDFLPEKSTMSAAKGFVKVLDGIQDKFRSFANFIISNVKPVFGKLYDAMSGDEKAVESLVRSIDELLRQTPFLKDLWYVLSGRSALIDPEGAVAWLKTQMKLIKEAFDELSPAITAGWEKIQEFQKWLFGSDNAYTNAVKSIAAIWALTKITSLLLGLPKAVAVGKLALGALSAALGISATAGAATGAATGAAATAAAGAGVIRSGASKALGFGKLVARGAAPVAGAMFAYENRKELAGLGAFGYDKATNGFTDGEKSFLKNNMTWKSAAASLINGITASDQIGGMFGVKRQEIDASKYLKNVERDGQGGLKSTLELVLPGEGGTHTFYGDKAAVAAVNKAASNAARKQIRQR